MQYRRVSLCLFLFACLSISVQAQLFKPFTGFRVIKTERFDIIFPKESEPAARLLASYADSVYDEVSSRLGIELVDRIPVTFAPHTDLFNGYYSPAPIPRIMLFNTPLDPEWTSFDNNLRALFLHELTHAVSLNTRSSSLSRYHRIFGNWVTPALLNTPLFMVEGVTISFESIDGFGRTNDPLFKQFVRQAIHEDKFLTPFQASGLQDQSVQWGSWYEYGGLFSAWLQQTYGMEKYAELWQGMGETAGISFSLYKSGFYQIFASVYGIHFLEAWEAFRQSLELNDVEDNENMLTVFRPENKHSISALSGNGDTIFILDQSTSRIRAYNTQTGKTRVFSATFPVSTDLDVSKDGRTLLVSGYQITGSRYHTVVQELSAHSGRQTGRRIQGLYKGRYFRDGVIGIRSDLHNNSIVYEDFNGRIEVLFRGNEHLMFSGPQAIDDDRIAFIVMRNGVRELMLYNYTTGDLSRIETVAGSGNQRNVWRHMRGLSVSGAKLFFSYNADDRMYRLASLDLHERQAVFSERDFSGGVSYPVSANGDIYYRGSFFSGDGLLRFPESADAISGAKTAIRLVPVNASESYGKVTVANEAAAANSYWNMPSKPYFSLPYMNPLRYWVPVPLLGANNADNANFPISFDGAGLFTAVADPAERHTIIALAYADIRYRMASIQTFNWLTTIPGFPVEFLLSDQVLDDTNNDLYRGSRMMLSAGFTRFPGRWRYGLVLGTGYTRYAYSDGQESAYAWPETGSAFFYTAGATLSNRQRFSHQLFGTGISQSLRGASIYQAFEPRIEGLLQLSAETLIPLQLALYGVYDMKYMNLQGVSRVYGQALFGNFASGEYPHPKGLNLSWLAGAEASVGLFSFEIQRNVSHLYFNRVFATLSVRSVLYDGQNHQYAEGIKVQGDMLLAQSLVLRTGLATSFIPLKLSPFSFEPNMWLAWRFSNEITKQSERWSFGVGFLRNF